MPVRKRQRRNVVHAEEVAADGDHGGDTATTSTQVMVRLVDEHGQPTGTQMLLPADATPAQLDELLRAVLAGHTDKNNADGDDDDDDARARQQQRTPYAFFIDGEQVSSSVRDNLFATQKRAFVDRMLAEGRRVRPQDVDKLDFVAPEETVVQITYKPQAVFRVRPVTRCAGTLDGHSEAVLIVAFSPDSQVLATGGGDATVRIWDVHTLTPVEELKAHSSWVQVLSWSPDGRHLVSGSKDGILVCWQHDGEHGHFKGRKQKAHSKYITHVAWEPQHMDAACQRFVSASKDTTLHVWSTRSTMALISLSGHQACVTCVKWGGQNDIYSSSQDRTIIVWDATSGSPRCVLRGHAHWVNFLALSTDLVMRTGAYDHEEHTFASAEEASAHARKRYDAVLERAGGHERVVSCSDDNTMFLWAPRTSTQPLRRLTGHQGVVFHIQFSPDGTLLASCSADKSVKLWNANTGDFITTFRGHVAAVYHVSWSLDSRLLASGSKDTTLKLWSVEKRALLEDMSGHSDEVYSTDWSPDGQKVATGSKDKRVRIWVH